MTNNLVFPALETKRTSLHFAFHDDVEKFIKPIISWGLLV